MAATMASGSPLRGVLFDIDGTLLDSNRAHARAWSEALREHGFDVSVECVLPLVGMGGDKCSNDRASMPAASAAADRGTATRSSTSATFTRRDRSRRRARCENCARGAGRHRDVSRCRELRETARPGRGARSADLCATSDGVRNSKPDPDIVARWRSGAGTERPSWRSATRHATSGAAERAGIACIAVRSRAGGTMTASPARWRSTTCRDPPSSSTQRHVVPAQWIHARRPSPTWAGRARALRWTDAA
jgi:phosphoglycolate phosphatase-like HAD superfamily hydrolase